MKQRENWIDWTKAIGIYLVVMGHYPFDSNNGFENLIFSFHMPLFFIISGYLFTAPRSCMSDIRGFIKKNTLALLVPYLIYSIISITKEVGSYVLRNKAFPVNYFSEALNGLLLGVGFPTENSIAINPPLWFLLSMFLTRVIYYVIAHRSHKEKLLYTTIMLLIAIYLHTHNQFLPFSLGATMLAFPFFYIGTLVKEFSIIEKVKKHKYLALIVAGIILAISNYYNSGKVDINYIKYQNLFLTFLSGTSGTLLVISIGLILDNIRYKFILTISNGTLLIMSMHIYSYSIAGVAKHLLNMLGVGVECITTVGMNICLSFIIIAIFYFPILLCEKYTPILLGKIRLK